MGPPAYSEREKSYSTMAMLGSGSGLDPGEQQGDREEERREQKVPFSISAILSEEVGRKKPHISSASSGSQEKPLCVGEDRLSSPLHETISLSQAASLMLSPPTHTSIHRSPPGPPGAPPPVVVTPGPLLPSLLPYNTSLSISPLNASLLSVLGHQASPVTPQTREDLFSDSLGMLSTVALYHSELSSMNASTPVQDRLAALKIASTSDTSDGTQDLTDVSQGAPSSKNSTTPYILKRDKRKRRRSLSGSSLAPSSTKPRSEDQATLNTGFLSPSAAERPPSRLTFSPSIFLSRPDHSSTSILSSSTATTTSPCSEGESTATTAGSFVTSTPIKCDKENSQCVSPLSSRSPGAVHLPGRRQLLREHNETSSGSDSEAPVMKKPRVISRRSKARTKLSPLLENACSPISKAEPMRPSSLVATNFVPTTSVQLQPPAMHTYMPTTIQHMDQTSWQMSQISYLPNTTFYSTEPYPSHLHFSQAYPYVYHPAVQWFHPPCFMPTKWSNHPPLLTQQSGTGQIQSVPPWFIFANNKSEGKRSRLTEAINRSLSETPSQNPKLPAEWTKYACGQTDDQRILTERARVFLQCRPRQLTFDEFD